jgi:hypothetical protein
VTNEQYYREECKKRKIPQTSDGLRRFIEKVESYNTKIFSVEQRRFMAFYDGELKSMGIKNDG